MGIRSVFAETYPMLLWYPGAEGSPEQAAPILETWTDYLVAKGLPITLKPIYDNHSTSEGMGNIEKIKPAVAITSLESYLYLSKKYSLSLLAQTRKQPAGDGSSQYIVVQNTEAKQIENLFLSEPLEETFMRNIVLRNSPHLRSLPSQYAKQILRTLKKIAHGELSGGVILTDYQEAVLKKMKADWVKKLKKLASSPSLPAPPVVLFEKWKKDFPQDKFVSLLIEMEKNPEGIEILEELRMKGFMTPDTKSYEALKASLEAP